MDKNGKGAAIVTGGASGIGREIARGCMTGQVLIIDGGMVLQ